MRAIIVGGLLLFGCASPSQPYYESTAYKAGERSEIIENQEPPMSEQRLEQNTLPLTEPEVTPAHP